VHTKILGLFEQGTTCLNVKSKSKVSLKKEGKKEKNKILT